MENKIVETTVFPERPSGAVELKKYNDNNERVAKHIIEGMLSQGTYFAARVYEHNLKVALKDEDHVSFFRIIRDMAEKAKESAERRQEDG